jgi:UDP-N-acetylmuramate dehydrogenase
VIKNELRGISYEQASEDVVRVTAAAGERWDEFVALTVEQGLHGLENLSGIPGTVGAAPVQNINAYGASVAEVIVAAEVYDGEIDEIKTISNEQCQFGYRDSIFKRTTGKHLVVTAVTFELTRAAHTNTSYRSSSQSIEKYLAEKNITTPTPHEVREAVLHVRSNIGMLEGQFRSAGSFFKNTIVSRETFAAVLHIVEKEYADISARLSPWHWTLPTGEEKIATAFLLECSPYNKATYGSKRFRGIVGLSPRHSLSVVTEEGATTTDVLEFVSTVQESVKNIFSVSIETEVDYIS